MSRPFKLSKTVRYWLCQVAGWGGWMLLQLFIAVNYASYIFSPTDRRNAFVFSIAADFIWFIFATHTLRLALKKLDWLRFSPEKVFLMFIAGVVFSSVVSFYGSKITAEQTGLSYEKYDINDRRAKAETMEADLNIAGTPYYIFDEKKKSDSIKAYEWSSIRDATGWYRNHGGQWEFHEKGSRQFWNVAFNFILTGIWLLIYLVWHYVGKNRRDQLDKLRLEGMVKSLELKTIKSHINPHFIFNALNSIRALVDENPQRARTAITELSNILRSSLKAETLETVPLQQELDIIKDYLALEHMRFEERLRIEMDIDPDTLTQPVPPMMLQTLVENAIKHGISKDVKGGLIRICSYFKDNHHELIVQNTGSLQAFKALAPKGFGLKSTQDRLNLLYNNQARFEIKDKDGNMVQSRVIMPVSEIL